MPAAFVRSAVTTPYSGSGDKMTCYFSANNLGDFLVIGIMQNLATNAAESFTIEDSAGNTWLPALASAFENSVQYSIWYVPSCSAWTGNTVTVTVGANTMQYSIVAGIEYSGILDAAVSAGYGAALSGPFTSNNDIGQASAISDLLHVSFALPYESQASGCIMSTGTGNSATARVSGSFYCAADVIVPGAPTIPVGGVPYYLWGFAASNFAYGIAAAIAFTYTPSSAPSGGKPTGTFGRNMIAGPEYTFECLPHGRKMAQVTIDCTVLPQVQSTVNYPEFSDVSNPGEIAGYCVVEFDLTNISNQMGLEECRTVLAFARPLYGYTPGSSAQDDFQAPGSIALPALLTCVSTRQTVVIGGYAASQARSAAFESAGYAFPVHGKTMQCRFLAPQRLNGINYGKYVLLFCNWDAGTPGASAGFFSQAVTEGSPPTGPAGGDLSGTYPDPTVASVHATSGSLDDVTIGATTLSPSISALQLSIGTGGVFTVSGGGLLITQGDIFCATAQFQLYSPGLANAPTGIGNVGYWSFTADGKISFCKGGTWEVVLTAP